MYDLLFSLRDGRPRTLLLDVLQELEILIASAFFPTPGPSTHPASERIQCQREMLAEFAPDIDAERVISENPVLRANQATQGCLTALILVTLLPAAFVVVL